MMAPRLVICVAIVAGASGASRIAGQASPPSLAPLTSVTLDARLTSVAAVNGAPVVAAGTGQGDVVVWNGRDQALVLKVKPHQRPVLAVASTADGRDVWSIADDGSLARTAIGADPKPASRTLEIGAAPATAAAFSTDGALVATGGPLGEVRVFDTATGTLKRRIPAHRTEVQSIAVGPKVIASASAEADLKVWDPASGREVASFDGDLSLFALAFKPGTGALASGGVDRRLTFRDAFTYKTAGVMTLQRPRMVATLAWSQDGRFIAMGDIDDESLSKGGIDIVNPATRATVVTLDTGHVPASAVVFGGEAGMIIAAVGKELRAYRWLAGRS